MRRPLQQRSQRGHGALDVEMAQEQVRPDLHGELAQILGSRRHALKKTLRSPPNSVNPAFWNAFTEAMLFQ